MFFRVVVIPIYLDIFIIDSPPVFGGHTQILAELGIALYSIGHILHPYPTTTFTRRPGTYITCRICLPSKWDCTLALSRARRLASFSPMSAGA
jgi:hypothetical protein